jgi:hypothetical protein
MAYAQKEVSVGFSEGNFLSGCHICYLFGDEDERVRVLTRFFEAGRRARERMLYLADRQSPDEMRTRLGFGHADEDMMAKAAGDFCYPDGQFSDDRMLEMVKAFYADAVRDGYTGARGSGEMSWTLRGVKGAELALRYEARLTDVLAEYPAVAICQYDVRLFDGAAVMDVLSTHPYTIVRGQLIQNPYFVEPSRFLERYRPTRS